MIRITIDLIPNGDEKKKKSLYHVDIVNYGRGTIKRGQYYYEMVEHDHIGEGLIHYIPITKGCNIKHNRSDSIFKLLFKVIKDSFK